MKVPPPRRRVDIEEALRLRTEEGLNGAQIAKRLGFYPETVRNAIRRGGGTVRPERSVHGSPHGPALYRLWKSLHKRCSSPNQRLDPRHGGRGRTVSKEWRTFWPFYDWALASGYKPYLSLALAGRSRTFSPRACRWITRSQRMEGGSRGLQPKHFIKALGETKSLTQWARDPRCGVTACTLWTRLRLGVPPELAVTLPPRQAARLPKDSRRALRVARHVRLDWDEVMRLYEKKGMGVREIARRFEADEENIRRGLRARRASTRPTLHHVHLRDAFRRMHRGCSNERDPGYQYNGARGARVCPEWARFAVFHAWALQSGYRPGLCLTRRAGTRVFSPANCSWKARAEIVISPPRSGAIRKPTWIVKAFGESKGPAAWSRDPRCEVSLKGLISRLRGGWRPEDALTTPPRSHSDTAEVRVTAFQQTKSVVDWSRDRRCKVTVGTLGRRIRMGVPPEEAIATPPFLLRNPHVAGGNVGRLRGPAVHRARLAP